MCGFHAVWPFYPTIANRYERPMHPTTPPWHADRRSAQGWRSQTEGEIFKGTDGACANPGTQNFPCHGARTQPTLPPSSLISLTFTATRQVLCFFLDSRKKRNPSPPVLRPSFYLRGLAKYDIMLQGIPFRLFWGGFWGWALAPGGAERSVDNLVESLWARRQNPGNCWDFFSTFGGKRFWG